MISEISFYDKKLKKVSIFYLSGESWIDENGDITSLDEIEYQMNHYARLGSIEFGSD